MINNPKIGIVGAGIQGVSNALFLQKKGFDVTLFLGWECLHCQHI